METAWGEIAVSDAHVHFFSAAFFEALAGGGADGVAARLGWEAPDADPAGLARRWAEELDRHGVGSAVLIASVPGDEGSVAAAVSAFPERFHGWFMLNPLAPDGAKRAETALDSGLKGVCLFPAMHRYSIQDERCLPILEAAEARGAVVFVHCGVLTVGIRKKLGLPSHFDMRFSNPIDLHAVALRFPGLSFIVPHFGAGYFREALMLTDLCPNVYLDTSSSNSWTRYQPEALDLPAVFRRSLDVAGASRLLFGSDSSFFQRGWNRAVFEVQVAALRAVRIGEADARLIFGGNLRRLMGVVQALRA